MGDDGKFKADGGWADAFQAVIPISGKVSTSEGGEETFGERVVLPLADAFSFLGIALFESGDFIFVAIEGFRQSGVLGLFSGEEEAPVHLVFDLEGPRFCVNSCIECFSLGRKAFSADLGLPLETAPLEEGCHGTPPKNVFHFRGSMSQKVNIK